ncbi:hypothetical protein GCM10011514_26560 [Emticicia aquatilis]|uniref:Alpha/beta hydrolase n=1 Tax=Emticicia aquatilis TaxID=1537369 RepID=A0A916YTW6_9BACT|nr:alpha/beta hydrolase-fold protein [Emticicia aquatilis]GGD61232.1 hypothetical protein GCM10011514_26560 [Emticicia aquatilis]
MRLTINRNLELIFKFSLVVLLSLNTAFAQFAYTKGNMTDFTIDSQVLKEKSKAFVYLPDDYDKNSEKYPVVYVLDGEYYFSLTTDAASLLAQSGIAPNCIIIGITTNNRGRDFSPKVDEDSGQAQDLKTAGGADNFLEYLEKELIPNVEKKYRTQPYRVIIGHSTGGLLAYYALYKKPNLFQAIISIDGSTWWNKGKIGKELIDFLNKNPDFKGKIFECRKDIKIPVRFPANVELLDYLDKKRPKSLEYSYLELPNETHGTIVFPGTYYGLKSILADYKNKKN